MAEKKIQWNKAQVKAIESRDGSVLVSAAAGSGKTAVLVERVIERICDEKNPCPADSLLVVTFTKAAAAEMKERINARLTELLQSDPGNRYLARQRMMLPASDHLHNRFVLLKACKSKLRFRRHYSGFSHTR